MAAVATIPERVGFATLVLRRRTIPLGLAVFAVILALALLAPLVAPYAPNRLSIVNRLKPPSGTYWFGTDEFGRDVFSRTIYAGRLSLLVGASVVTFAALVGVTLGLLSALAGRSRFRASIRRRPSRRTTRTALPRTSPMTLASSSGSPPWTPSR